jgi:cupin fold WbuC family metalloprotein
MKLTTITQQDITLLKLQAQGAPHRRARIILHKDHDDSLQDMVIALNINTYLRPHRHPVWKHENYHIIEGTLQVFTYCYDETKGPILLDRICLSPSEKIMCRIPGGVWHQPIPLTTFVVYHEIYSGPWRKDRDVEYAPWAKKESV